MKNCCFYCGHYRDGKCYCNNDFEPINGNNNMSPTKSLLVKFFEDGYADDIIRESLPDFEISEEYLFDEMKVSEKRKEILKKRIYEYYEDDLKIDIINEISDKLYTALLNRVDDDKENISIKIKNPFEFCCKNYY